MHTTRTTLIIATSAIALGLAGCATPGTPEPTPGQETSTAANDPFHIAEPKNLSAVADACQLLNQDQIGQLSAGQPVPGQSEWGQGRCGWSNQLFAIELAPDTAQGQGISWMAKTAGDNGKPNAKVNGYPAVHYGETRGSCATLVGTSDTETLLVNYQIGSEGRGNPEYEDPCGMADKVAGMVLENLPPA
ncbi:DUF3558 domain-containing protein [Saccharopolyspora hattusasensis]|uniref:DUF3558 domain-containing protein n=1 Tax=Saccharopolyspora hattusasensis TaxID=1128679 RepID=UPI003D993C1F